MKVPAFVFTYIPICKAKWFVQLNFDLYVKWKTLPKQSFSQTFFPIVTKTEQKDLLMLLSWCGVSQSPQTDPSWCHCLVSACYQSSSPQDLEAAWSSCVSRWGWWWVWAERVQRRKWGVGAALCRCWPLPSGSALPTTCNRWAPFDSGTCGSSPTGWPSRTECEPSQPWMEEWKQL